MTPLRALLILAAMALPGRAAAQERVTTALIPDLDLVEPAIPRSLEASDFDRGPRLMGEMGASMGAAVADVPAGGLPALGHGRLRWGVRPSRATSLRVRSEVGVEDAGPDSLTGMITGRHDLHVQLGLGPDRKKGVGADVIARGRFHHLGDNRRALGPVDIGAGAHTEAALSLTTALRLTDKPRRMDSSGLTFPVTAGLRRIDYLGRDAVVSRALTRSMSGGIGARMIDRHAVDLLIQLLGVSHARTELEPAPGWVTAGGAGAPARVTQTTGRMGELDLAIYDHSVVVAATGYTGWTWMRDEHSQRSANLIVMQYGFKIRGMGEAVGLGFGRTGSATADGQRFVAEYRLEAHGEWQGEHHGGLVRALTSWLSDKERDGDDDPGVLGRHALHSEVYARLPGGVKLGGYGLAAYQPEVSAWDPWQGARGWSVEMGGFVRWAGEHWAGGQ